MPGVAFPPVGPVGYGSPPSSVLCSAKTATVPLSGRFARRSLPDTLPASVAFVVSLTGSWSGWKPPDHARAFGHPVPLSGSLTRRQVALPSSRVTPMDACPALRPRWCPDCSPLRLQDCCLPATGNRRLFLGTTLRIILLSTTIPISGLNHMACVLATPGSVPLLAETHAGSLLTCWLGFSQVGLEPYRLAPTG